VLVAKKTVANDAQFSRIKVSSAGKVNKTVPGVPDMKVDDVFSEPLPKGRHGRHIEDELREEKNIVSDADEQAAPDNAVATSDLPVLLAQADTPPPPDNDSVKTEQKGVSNSGSNAGNWWLGGIGLAAVGTGLGIALSGGDDSGDNTPTNTAPVITSNGGGATASISMAENQTAVTTVTASDVDAADGKTFSISGGADASKFHIDAATGVLTFVAAPNFEAPADAGVNNVYDVQVTVTDTGGLTDVQNLAVTVTNVNDNPVNSITDSNAAANSITENAATGTVAGITALATDADTGATVSYSLSDNAGGRFAINSTTGVITVANGTLLDYESATGHDVTVLATSSDGSNNSQVFTVSLTNVNDDAVITGTATGAITESNAVQSVSGDLNATDVDSAATFVAQTAAAGSNGYGTFTIDASGAWTYTMGSAHDEFVAGTNYTDSITVATADGTTQVLTVTIAGSNDAPVINSDGGSASASTITPENTTAVTTVTATDADAGAVLAYSISGGADGAKFSIDANTGALSFRSAPDFEAPTDSGANNVYDVQVTASDGAGGTTAQNIAVTVTAVNDNNPAFTSAATANVAENSTAVLTVAATDDDLPAQSVTYSITGGADQTKFAITSGGVLSFVSAPNFEAPTDATFNNVYDVQVTASDGAGGTTAQNIAVTVTAVNDNTPVFTSSATANVAENSTAVLTVAATDADLPAQSVTYSITGGADSSKFAITSGGVLSFVSAPDFETPTDSGGNNVYDVQVTANDGAGGTTAQNIAVTVTAVNDNNPIFTSAATANVAENSPAVLTVTATDADLPAQTVTYSITGGADQTKFAITSGGVLSFVSAPDFETPTDSGANNVYDVQVTASDGAGGTTAQNIAVTVTAVNDNNPAFTSAATANVAENSTAVLTVAATDDDLPAQSVTYSITGGADQTKFAITSGGVLSFVSAPNFEAPTDATFNNVYDVQVTASDGAGGTTAQNIAVTVTAVNDNTPVFTSSATANVAENSTAVLTVAATDADLPAQSVTYSITGGADSSKFAITSGGVLSFVSAPDFETPTDSGGNNVYDVQVTANDGAGGTTAQNIAVTVTAVNDNNPIFTSATTANVAENSTAVLTVAATDADLPAQTVTYSITGGVDQDKFSIDASTGALAFASVPDFENPVDADTNNSYVVQVTADDGNGGTTSQTITATVNNVNEAPVITSDGGTDTAAVNVAENSTAVTTVTATDADAGAVLSYSIAGGVDALKFAIDAGTGALTFKASPDFEAPTDAGGNNVYDVTVQISDGINTDTQAIAVSVTNTNDNSPVITSGSNFSVTENTTAVTTVTATDADAGSTLTYSIVGGDPLFTIDPNSGVLDFVTAPNFEAPTIGVWTGQPNNYYARVQVSDGTYSSTQNINVVVTNVNEAPVITSNGSGDTAAISIPENATVLTTVTATDQDAGATQTYSISSGADADKFSIDANTGVLNFLAQPNFDMPADADLDNVYDVTVQVSDGTLTDTQDIAVTVTAAVVNVPPVITSDGGGDTAAVNVAENSTAVTTVTATDADAGAVLSYSIAGGVDALKFAIDAGTGALTFKASPDFEAPTDAGGNNVYDVTVQISDGINTDTQAIAVSVTNTNDNSPVITSGSNFSVTENTTAVTTVTATDADAGSTLTYSIVGGDPLFTIDPNSGVLDFVTAPNFEAPTIGVWTGQPNNYYARVQVSDGTYSSTQNINVVVTNVNEAPVITSNGSGDTVAITMPENATVLTTVTATDQDAGATQTYSLAGGSDEAKFTIDASTGVLNFVTQPDFDAPTDAGGDNVYDVIVQVSDGTLTDSQAIAITVNPVNDNDPIFTTPTTANVAENTTAVMTVAATDADAITSMSYSITGGADADKFVIDPSSGALSFASAPDFETPTDTDTDTNNSYLVQVTADDGYGRTTAQTITVSVTDTNETPPVINAPNSGDPVVMSFGEGTSTVADVDATDADTAQTITYSLSGVDAGQFFINDSTGEVIFANLPDFENPADSDLDNTYTFTVTATDNGTGNLADTQNFAVTVTNAYEDVVVEAGGAFIDKNANGVKDAEDTIRADFEDPTAPGYINLANQITIHYNDAPLNALNLAGFGTDDLIEIDAQLFINNGHFAMQNLAQSNIYTLDALYAALPSSTGTLRYPDSSAFSKFNALSRSTSSSITNYEYVNAMQQVLLSPSGTNVTTAWVYAGLHLGGTNLSFFRGIVTAPNSTAITLTNFNQILGTNLPTNIPIWDMVDYVNLPVSPDPVRVVVDQFGAVIDINGNGVRDYGENWLADFSVGGNADLDGKSVVVQFNDLPNNPLDLTGFGENDLIEIDAQALYANGYQGAALFGHPEAKTLDAYVAYDSASTFAPTASGFLQKLYSSGSTEFYYLWNTQQSSGFQLWYDQGNGNLSFTTYNITSRQLASNLSPTYTDLSVWSPLQEMVNFVNLPQELQIVVDQRGAFIEIDDANHVLGVLEADERLNTADFDPTYGNVFMGYNHVTIHYNDVPNGDIDLSGFGSDDLIEIDVQAFIDNGHYNLQIMNQPGISPLINNIAPVFTKSFYPTSVSTSQGSKVNFINYNEYANAMYQELLTASGLAQNGWIYAGLSVDTSNQELQFFRGMSTALAPSAINITDYFTKLGSNLSVDLPIGQMVEYVNLPPAASYTVHVVVDSFFGYSTEDGFPAGAVIDYDGDGVRDEGENWLADFGDGGNADLGNMSVLIHFNEAPMTALDLTGFGTDDRIEIAPGDSWLKTVTYNSQAHAVSYQMAYFSSWPAPVTVTSTLRIVQTLGTFSDLGSNQYTSVYGMTFSSTTWVSTTYNIPLNVGLAYWNDASNALNNPANLLPHPGLVEFVWPVNVVVESEGAYIDANANGVYENGEVAVDSFQAGGNADLAANNVIIHFNDIPDTPLDLAGFNGNDRIEIDLNAMRLDNDSVLRSLQNSSTFSGQTQFYAGASGVSVNRSGYSAAVYIEGSTLKTGHLTTITIGTSGGGTTSYQKFAATGPYEGTLAVNVGPLYNHYDQVAYVIGGISPA
jgi:VCBS repeat-containing protein